MISQLNQWKLCLSSSGSRGGASGPWPPPGPVNTCHKKMATKDGHIDFMFLDPFSYLATGSATAKIHIQYLIPVDARQHKSCYSSILILCLSWTQIHFVNYSTCLSCFFISKTVVVNSCTYAILLLFKAVAGSRVATSDGLYLYQLKISISICISQEQC